MADERNYLAERAMFRWDIATQNWVPFEGSGAIVNEVVGVKNAADVRINPATEETLATLGTEATLDAVRINTADIEIINNAIAVLLTSIDATVADLNAKLPNETAIPAKGVGEANPVVSRIGTYPFVWDSEDDRNERLVGNDDGGLYVNPQMPSHGVDRSKVHYASPAILTASGTLFTYTVGRHLHITSMSFSGINSSIQANTYFRLRDGGAAGPIIYTFLHGQASVGAPEHFEADKALDEHWILHGEVTASLYLEIVAGNLQLVFNIEGYEAATP